MQPRDVDLGRYLRMAVLWALYFVLVLTLGIAWLGLDEILPRLARLSVSVVLLVLGLSLFNYLLRALRWQVLSEAVGVRVPLVRNSLYYVAGFAFTITPGKLGEVIRLWLLRRHHGVPYERSLGPLVVDRVTDAVPLLALCLLGAGRVAGQGWGLVAVTVFVLTGVALILRPGWLAFLVRAAYGRLRRLPRLFVRILRTLRLLQVLAAPRVLALALLLGLVGWSAEILGAWLVLDALGAEIDLLATAFIFSFAMLVGALPLFPGGVGGAEGTMIAFLLLAGVDNGAAVTATAIIRLATLGFAVVLGFLALPMSLARPAPSAGMRSSGSVL